MSSTNSHLGPAMKPIPQRQWTTDAMVRGRQVSGVDVSPDGMSVAFAVDEALMQAECSEYVSRLHVAAIDGSYAFPLTHGEKRSANPQWSPDGESIAFLSNRSGNNNIWIIRRNGGESRALTDLKGDVVSFRWSPDGTSIAFVAFDPPDAGRERATREKNDPKIMDDASSTTRRWTKTRLWGIPVTAAKPQARCLSPDGCWVANHITFQYIPGFERSFDWSPDGRHIAFVHVPSPRGNDWTRADISIVDVESGAVSGLAHSPGSRNSPIFSPDGVHIALVATDQPPTWGFNKSVWVVPLSSGEARELAGTFDRQPDLIGWAADGRSLYFTETRGIAISLSMLPLDGAPVEICRSEGVFTGIQLNCRRSMFGFTRQDFNDPPEAYVSAVAPFEAKRVSSANIEAKDPESGRTEMIRWKSIDGLEIEGLLTLPPGYEAGKPLPLALVIHGGPMAVFTREFNGSRTLVYPIAALAARGYAVLRCNIRGSSGYGRDFRYLNISDWGGMDYRDLMSGVDHVVEMGVADPERLVVLGWSYGGYMASWIITQTHRFRAAVIGVPVTNLASFTWTSEVPDFIPNFFGGEPWDKPETYLAHSPVMQAKTAKTPALILHGELDDRVPVSQGYELYYALKRAGCVAEMVVYPRSLHVPAEPKLLLDSMNRTLDWFDRYTTEE